MADTQNNTDVLLVDLSSLLYPLWHMNIDAPNPNEASVKALARIRAMVPEGARCAICIDSGRSFRKDIDPRYKANRAEHDARVTHQLTLAAEKLRADGYTVIGAAGFEADDIIATATRQLTEQGATVKILSSDKDLMALVCPTVRQQSLTNGTVYDDAEVFKKFGVGPEQIRDFLTLTGDASDNIPGVKSIGPAKAAQVLAKGRTLDAVIEAMQNAGTAATLGIAPAVFTAIVEHGADIALSRELVTLRTDAPITVKLADLTRKQPEPEDMMPEQDDIDYALASLSQQPTEAIDRQERLEAAALRDARIAQAATAPTAQASPATAPTAIARRDDPQAPDVLAPAPAEWERQLEPRSMREAAKMAELMFKSRMFSAYGTPEAVLSTILAGRELGMQMMASLRAFHVIENKSVLPADLIQALVIRSGVCKFFRNTERTNEAATFEAQRGDDPPISLRFTVEDGRRAWSRDQASFDKSGWGRNPADLCVARARAKLSRLIAPDVVHGLYAVEEFDV